MPAVKCKRDPAATIPKTAKVLTLNQIGKALIIRCAEGASQVSPGILSEPIESSPPVIPEVGYSSIWAWNESTPQDRKEFAGTFWGEFLTKWYHMGQNFRN